MVVCLPTGVLCSPDGPRCDGGQAVEGRVRAAESGNPHGLEKTGREGLAAL